MTAKNVLSLNNTELIKVAAWSKAWSLFALSNTRIVGLNPVRGMEVCLRLFCLCR
jgi:hypothetical protein